MAAKKTSARADKAPSPATLRYALASARTTLGDGDEDTTVEENAGVVKFVCSGVHYATLRVDGGELVVSFLAPEAPGEAEDKLGHYAKQPGGWLEWRTPVARDPRPWLVAGVGGLVGTTLFEILNRGRKT